MAEDLEELAKKYALRNAIKHDGVPNANSILSSILGNHPEYRENIEDAKMWSQESGSWVEGLNEDELIYELKERDPIFFDNLGQKEIIEKTLPDLEGAENGVVMRLAPNPSGPLHIGHTRMAILNDEYVKRYGGKLIVRMEDTNPPTIMPEAYDMIQEDLDWLGVKYHDVINQSSRFDIYYDHAQKLLENGSAYMCQCPADDWRAKKEVGEPCPHRDATSEVNLNLWERMLAGDFKPGEISLMVKTDLKHPNPAVRDFVGLRLVDEPHPLTGDEHCVYPLYNFSVAIDDHLMEMTHVLRGKDHLNNTLRQEYIYQHLGWPKPQFLHYGWVSIEDTVLSTRQIKAAIEEGKYTGWDDVRLGTVKALARRGIQPNAIRQYWIDVGTNAVDIKFSWQNLYAYNKQIVDPVAKRYFFVWDPKTVNITGVEELGSRAPLHPEKPELGSREVTLSGDPIELQVVSEDVESLPPQARIRFKDLCNSILEGDGAFAYSGNDLAFIKEGAKIIHWVGPDAVPARVHIPDGKVIEGLVEKASLNSINEVVQFERFGFVRLESGEKIDAYFTHK